MRVGLYQCGESWRTDSPPPNGYSILVHRQRATFNLEMADSVKQMQKRLILIFWRLTNGVFNRDEDLNLFMPMFAAFASTGLSWNLLWRTVFCQTGIVGNLNLKKKSHITQNRERERESERDTAYRLAPDSVRGSMSTRGPQRSMHLIKN